MSIAQRLVNLADGLSADGVLSAAKGGTGNTTGGGTTSPTVSQISYLGNDTAADPSGGTTITLTGTNFASGAKVLINNTQVGVVTVVSATQITFTAPQLAAGSYILYVVNLDGSTAIAVPGIQYSGVPAWSTPAGSLGTSYETGAVSASLSATSDSAVSYSVTTGTLPSGATLNPNGTISGTSPLVSGSTTYTFTVRATDAENQDTDRSFSLTVNPDVVSWSTPTNGATLSGTPNTAYSSALTATSAAGSSISYTADSLPAGLSISGSAITGTPTAAGTSTTTLTATAATTSKSAQITINWTINVAADAYFKYTTLLLNAETTAAPFIADASANNFAVTTFGDTKPNSFNPYTPGYYSNYFDGSGDYLSSTNWNNAGVFGTGDFTVECWLNVTGAPNSNQVVWACNSYPATTGISLQYDSIGVWHLYAGSTAVITVSSSGLSYGSWFHVAVVRASGTLTIYMNGVSKGTASFTTNCSDGLQFIGRPYDIANFMYQGYISNFRIVKGTAVYTGAFNPPTQPLTAIANTSLLTCQANRFADSSTNAYTITTTGDVKVSSFDPFVPNTSYANYGSTYFDGTGDYLAMPPNATSLAMGTGNFTIEFWINTSNIAQTGYVLQTDIGANSLYISLSGSTIRLTNAATVFAVTPTLLSNTWYHIAVVRSGTSSVIYTNGVAGTAVTCSIDFTQNGPTIGANSFIGYLSDYRIVKGTAVYTANFTPPTTPLTAVANTQLLTCQTNQPANNSVFLDNSSNALVVNRNGGATQGSFSPYGANWSLNCNAGSDNANYINTPTSANLRLDQGNWTIEFWIYITAWNTNNRVFDTGANGDGAALVIGYSNTGVIGFGVPAPGTGVNTPAGAIGLNNWYHVAMVSGSNGTAGKVFVNGTLQVGPTNYTVPSSTAPAFNIGRNNVNAGDWDGLQGYMSNFRFVSGQQLYSSNFTPQTTPLHTNKYSTDGGTTMSAITGKCQLLTLQNGNYIDNSNNNFTITPNGSNISLQKFSPFAPTMQTPVSYSTYFDGTGDYLTLPSSSAFSMGTGNFTIEAWIYATSSGTQRIVSSTGNNFEFLLVNTGSNVYLNWYDGVGDTTSGSNYVPQNSWTHVAVSRSGTSLKLFINGVVSGSSTNSVNLPSSPTLYIGRYGGSDTNSFVGYLSNLRITNTAVYTANFTPSTEPLTAVAGTSLLTCQSPTIVDNSTNAFTITAAGDARARQQNPFGYTTSSAQEYSPAVFGASAYFDGSGDYIKVITPNAFGSSEYTIECWVYHVAIPNPCWLWDGLTDGGTGPQIFTTGSGTTLNFYKDGSTQIINAAVTLKLNQWTHYAFCRVGTTTTAYVNGIAVGSGTDNTTSSTSIRGGFGARVRDGAEANQAYFGDYRIVVGKAIYRANFLPPTAPLTAIPGTILLLNMDKAAIADKSGKVVAETIGDSKLSTAIKKYGSASMYFDGTGDYLTFATNPQYAFGTGDFTVECWVNSANVTSNQKGFLQTSDTAGGFQTSYTSGITFLFGAGVSGGNAVSLSGAIASNVAGTYVGSSTAVITADTWTHVALVRSSGTATMYVNGVSVGSASAPGNCSGNNLVVGGYYSTGYLYSGYLDDLRITKGYARYTANFTPPTEALLTK